MSESILRVIRDFQEMLQKKLGKESFEGLVKEVLSDCSDLKPVKADQEEEKKGVAPVREGEEVIDLNTLAKIDPSSIRYCVMPWSIIHPYEDYYHIDIELVLRTEVKDSLPHGMCLITYDKDENPNKNFKGIGFMSQGQLHGGPAFFMTGDGRLYKYLKMINGRPFGLGSNYCGPQETGEAIRFEKKIKVSMAGWLSYHGEFVDAAP